MFAIFSAFFTVRYKYISDFYSKICHSAFFDECENLLTLINYRHKIIFLPNRESEDIDDTVLPLHKLLCIVEGNIFSVSVAFVIIKRQ